VYAISVTNRKSASCGVLAMTVDGVAVTDGWISLVDDGSRHVVAILVGAAETSS
jgi:hypothetical protein